MSTRPGILTESDHENMDRFLGQVLEAHKAGDITQKSAIATLAHVIAAIDEGNHGEALNWFKQGRKFILAGR